MIDQMKADEKNVLSQSQRINVCRWAAAAEVVIESDLMCTGWVVLCVYSVADQKQSTACRIEWCSRE